MISAVGKQHPVDVQKRQVTAAALLTITSARSADLLDALKEGT